MIISRTTPDTSPNELVDPEILMKIHLKHTLSFGLILLAIFPDTAIFSYDCIVLLFETNSLSHFVNLKQQYLGSKGVRDSRQEELLGTTQKGQSKATWRIVLRAFIIHVENSSFGRFEAEMS